MRKFKYIASFGCSFTRDAIEHENPSRPSHDASLIGVGKISFTKFLADKLNVPFINLGVGGSSLFYTYRKIYHHIKLNPETVKDTLFIWGLTLIDRYDWTPTVAEVRERKFSDEVTPYLHTEIPKKKMPFPHQVTEEFSQSFGCSLGELDTMSNFFTKYIYDDAAFETNYLMHVDTYTNHLRNLGINLLVVNLMGDIRSKHRNSRDPVMIPGTYVWPEGVSSWRAYLRKSDPTYAGEHPNADDHKKMGDRLYSYIQENLEK